MLDGVFDRLFGDGAGREHVLSEAHGLAEVFDDREFPLPVDGPYGKPHRV